MTVERTRAITALAETLANIERCDPSNPHSLSYDASEAEQAPFYSCRAELVYLALGLATNLGYPCGFRLDPAQPGWPVAYIDLPTGQVSWHMKAYPREWDGHDTAEKYRRTAYYVAAIPA